MDNAYIIVAVVVALAVIVVFTVIAKRLAKPVSPPVEQVPQEPSFVDTNASTLAQTGQGELRINKVKVPDLPDPVALIPVLEMCYVIRLYGEVRRDAAEFNDLQEKFLPRQAPRELFLAYDEDTKKWRNPVNAQFTHWLLAVPLANRNGVLTAVKIKLLEEEIRRFAEKRNLHAVFPPVAESLKNAELLDEFCNTADVVVELWLSGKKIKVAEIADMARVNGLVKDDKGQYALREESEILFFIRLLTVRGTDEVMRIIFELDAPNVSSPIVAFDRMYRHLERMASVLKMSTSDPRGEVVDSERLGLIRKQLTILERQMREFGVPPGGTIARLLFN